METGEKPKPFLFREGNSFHRVDAMRTIAEHAAVLGIKPEHIEEVGEIFDSSHPTQEGDVHGIIERLNGEYNSKSYGASPDSEEVKKAKRKLDYAKMLLMGNH